jgi:hypothetical protein
MEEGLVLLNFVFLQHFYAVVPELLTNFPPSPGCASMLNMFTPSGMSFNAIIVPGSKSDEDNVLESPTATPSGAINKLVVLSLYSASINGAV